MNLTTGLMIAQLLLNIIIAVAGWIALRRKATAEEIAKLRASLEEMQKSQAVSCGQHQSRTGALEVQIKAVPTHTDLGDIHERINGVKGSVDEMTGLVRAMSPQIRLLVEHHINGGGK